MKAIFTLFLLLIFSCVSAQQPPAPAACDEVFTVVEEMPVFSKGDIMVYIRKNAHLKMDSTGSFIVWIEFIVNREGKTTDVKCIKNSKSCEPCEEEAIRVINNAPVWTPGKQNGEAVCVRYTVPVYFRRCR